MGVIAVSAATSWVINSKNTPVYSENTNSTSARFVNLAEGTHTDFTTASELTINCVVHVKTKYTDPNSANSDPLFEFFFGRPQIPPRDYSPQGSGVIISSDGYIVTNNHVIDKATEIEVTLNDKRTFRAKLVGNDPNTDLALLKIEATDLPAITFGNSDDLKVGEWVLAVGNPFNLTSTVTAGIVSAKARNINILNTDMKIESFIQTDAAINPGNSGGALVNVKGELIGINTAIASRTGSYSGYAFAVPSSIVSKIVTDLKQYGVVQRAVLGVEIRDIDEELAKNENLKTLTGVFVARVIENGSAAIAGMKNGDIIQEINGIKISSTAQLQEQMGKFSPGDKIKISIIRGQKPQTIDVLLKNRQGNTRLVESDNANEVLSALIEDVPNKLKQNLGLTYGLWVKKAGNGKIRAAGIKDGFIIIKVNNQAMRTLNDLYSALDAAENSSDQDKVLFVVGVYPNGELAYYAVSLR